MPERRKFFTQRQCEELGPSFGLNFICDIGMVGSMPAWLLINDKI
jgi:hypothetical protein